VAQRALQAGKHVMLEKPVGPSVADALQALAAHRALPRPPVWLLAENYRWAEVVRACVLAGWLLVGLVNAGWLAGCWWGW
jgi:predicted dehydrogenase